MLLKNTNITKIQDIEERKGIVEMYVSVFDNIDHDRDIIKKGAFTKTLSENKAKIAHLVDHNWSVMTMVGIPVSMKEDDFGLLVTSQLDIKNNKLAADLFAKYIFYAEHDRSFDHSIGFEIPKNKSFFDKEKNANVITEVKLYEYSTVLYGANPLTFTTDIKGYEKLLNQPYPDAVLQAIEKRLEKFEKLISDYTPKPDQSTSAQTEQNPDATILKELLKRL